MQPSIIKSSFHPKCILCKQHMFCAIEFNCSYALKEQLHSWRPETRPFPYNAAVLQEAKFSVTIAMVIKTEHNNLVVN